MLRQLRQNLGWSVHEVEQRTCASRSTLSRLERGRTEPTISAVVRLPCIRLPALTAAGWC
ncbi:helix-turn-helix domain-containing protein [Streptomyces sp. NPDC001348]